VVVAEPVGLLPDAQVQLPDIQMTGLVPGAAIRVEGSTTARLARGDFAAIWVVVTGERAMPLGQWTDWVTAQGRASKPGSRECGGLTSHYHHHHHHREVGISPRLAPDVGACSVQ
jgi:hypothetical protein